MDDPGHHPAEAAPPRRGRALLVIAPTLAIVGLVLAFLPGASFVAGVPALASVVLAIVLLVIGARRSVAVASASIAVVAVVIAIVVSVAQVGTAVHRFASGLPERDDPPAVPGTDGSDGSDSAPDPRASTVPLSAGRHLITYEVLGDGSARVAYTALVGGRFGASDEPSVPVPHRRVQRVEVRDGATARFSMIVSRVSGVSDPLGCRISIDGDVVSEQPERAGSAAVANCVVTAG